MKTISELKPNRVDRLAVKLRRLSRSKSDQEQMAAILKALDERYSLSMKLEQESGLGEIIVQLFDRLLQAYGDLGRLEGKRILDIACGSSTSKAPAVVHIRGSARTRIIRDGNTAGFSAYFEPWLCRMLLALGAQPVGVDIGDLESEAFEHYQVDLGAIGALDFLPDHSFDGILDSRLFGSPEFTAQFQRRADRMRIAAEIVRQERRLLKTGGVILHSDAMDYR